MFIVQLEPLCLWGNQTILFSKLLLSQNWWQASGGFWCIYEVWGGIWSSVLKICCRNSLFFTLIWLITTVPLCSSVILRVWVEFPVLAHLSKSLFPNCPLSTAMQLQHCCFPLGGAAMSMDFFQYSKLVLTSMDNVSTIHCRKTCSWCSALFYSCCQGIRFRLLKYSDTIPACP